MGENFRKFTIEMEWKQDGYRMWKHGAEEVTCFVESYKEKRSIYLGVVNLLPSAVLAEEQGGEYHLLLLGAAEGELLHRDFGVFRVNRRGQGSLFCKFTGPELECYSHCLLVAIQDGEHGICRRRRGPGLGRSPGQMGEPDGHGELHPGQR
jgi:hypothetical protein